MKKWIIVLLSLIMILTLCACENQNSSNSSHSTNNSYTNSSNTSTNKGLSDSEIKAIVSDALYKKVKSYYDTADPDSCKFSINKIEEKYGTIYVYGSVTLYDKYGKLTGGWVDGSGTAFRTFSLKIDSNGRASAVEID